jgi:hypothetical protein
MKQPTYWQVTWKTPTGRLASRVVACATEERAREMVVEIDMIDFAAITSVEREAA